MSDQLIHAQIREAGLAVTLALSTQLCRQAQQAHHLRSTSAIALGRLLSANALVGFSQQRSGSTSMQILASGRLEKVFSDVNAHGHLRGFVKNTELDLPHALEKDGARRRSIALALGRGSLTVIYQPPQGEFVQSTTSLVSGEIDLDIENYLQQSEQISSALACEVLLDDDEQLRIAGGVLLQCLPGGDKRRLAMFRTMLDDGFLSQALNDMPQSPRDLLQALLPDAELLEKSEQPLRWQCSCSYQRVLGAIQMFEVDELQHMLDNADYPKVKCEFCGTHYEIAAADLKSVYLEKKNRDDGVKQ